MPTIYPDNFKGRKWKEQEAAGWPAPLFFSDPESDTPWKVMPHLHIGYSFDGALQSLTYKNVGNNNTTLFLNGYWLVKDFNMIDSEKIKAELTYIAYLPQ